MIKFEAFLVHSFHVIWLIWEKWSGLSLLAEIKGND